MPLISLRLEHMTGSGFLVGLNGAAAALSTLLMAPLVPRFMGVRPPRQILALSLVAAAALFILFPLLPHVWVWFIVRFAVGCFMTVIFVISESWINQVVSAERRALMLGVYGTALSGGFGIGGGLFTALAHQGDIAFYVASLIFVLGVLPVLALRGPDPQAPDEESATLGAMVRTALLAPTAIMAGLAFGAAETLVFALMPVYAERISLSHTEIGLVMLAVAAGALVFQIPLGWIADRIGRRLILGISAALAAISPILTALVGADLTALLPLVFVQAGVTSALYTVGLSLLGERFTGGSIASANAAFIFAYGLGSLVGPPAGGVMMDVSGPAGLLGVLSGFAAAYLALILVRSWMTARGS